MKGFIDDKGTFYIKVPITWRYFLHSGRVHTFQEYRIWKSDTFQISIDTLDKNGKINILNVIKSLLVTKIGDLLYYSFPDNATSELTTKSWIRLFEDTVVLFTTTYPNNPDKVLDNVSLEERVESAHKIIKEFKLIDKIHSASVINSYRFNMFMQGFGATSLILEKAIGNKAFIEATCIIANQIDSLLRIGIVLKTQIIKKNREIELEWIYQGLLDKKKSEKDIYKKTLDLGIIDQTIFDELYKLYDFRNRVIHRFVISEITMAEVEEIAFQYYTMSEKLNKVIYDLESEQIKLNVGMTTISDGHDEGNLLEFIKGKIGTLDYFKDKDTVKTNASS